MANALSHFDGYLLQRAFSPKPELEKFMQWIRASPCPVISVTVDAATHEILARQGRIEQQEFAAFMQATSDTNWQRYLPIAEEYVDPSRFWLLGVEVRRDMP